MHGPFTPSWRSAESFQSCDLMEGGSREGFVHLPTCLCIVGFFEVSKHIKHLWGRMPLGADRPFSYFIGYDACP